MSKKLLALTIMTAMTGLINTAKAEEVPLTLDSVTGARHQDTHLVMLTDTEMDEITAGHVDVEPATNAMHWGNYWQASSLLGIPYITYGNHSGCGLLPCFTQRAY